MSAGTPSALSESWQPLKTRVEAQLAYYIDEFLDAGCPDSLREAMRYSLQAGGKRLRPVLVLLAAEACGGSVEAALPAACAIEMVHTYSLIHDDLPAMDDDDLRRGRPTCHIAFDEATAILAGDALLTLAFEVLARDISAPAVAAGCCADLARAAGPVGMVGGQVVDLTAESSPERTIEFLESIHRRKTGELISCSLLMGGRTAGAEATTLARLEKFGKCVGLAFQIADDLLDITGNPETIGKAVQKDADRGKLTYPGLLGVDESRARAERLVAEACACVAELGPRSRRLEQLAKFVLERDH